VIYVRFSIPRFWREIDSRYRLKATKCEKCSRVNYPPSKICRFCGSDKTIEIYLDKEKAKLITWTVIYNPPYGFENKKPLIIGIVETLETKTKLLVSITDLLPEELKEGLELEPVLRRVNEDGEHGLIHYGIKYRPVLK